MAIILSNLKQFSIFFYAGQSDRDAVWGLDSDGLREPCITWGADPPKKMGNFGGISAMAPFVKILLPLVTILPPPGLKRSEEVKQFRMSAKLGAVTKEGSVAAMRAVVKLL